MIVQKHPPVSTVLARNSTADGATVKAVDYANALYGTEAPDIASTARRPYSVAPSSPPEPKPPVSLQPPTPNKQTVASATSFSGRASAGSSDKSTHRDAHLAAPRVPASQSISPCAQYAGFYPYGGYPHDIGPLLYPGYRAPLSDEPAQPPHASPQDFLAHMQDEPAGPSEPQSPLSSSSALDGELHCRVCHATSRMLQDFFQRLTSLEQRLSLMQHQRWAQAHTAPSAAGSVYSADPSGLMPQIPIAASAPSASINRADLDPFLAPLLRRSAKLSSQALEQAVKECQAQFAGVEREHIRSAIREWFRKHREYMTHRIDAYGTKHFRLKTREHVLRELADIRNVDRIRRECVLDVTDYAEARNYVLERVASYFDRRERIERRKRNSGS